MHTLSVIDFEAIKEIFFKRSRSLEQAIFVHRFERENEQEIVNELSKFQNEDGGFGHGIESDFRLPLSSPMHTSVALRILSENVSDETAEAMTKKAFNYLEEVFDYEKQRWFTVSKEVNNYPHAPWWNFDTEHGITVIDNSWGNPSAELAAYLLEKKQYLKRIDIDALNEIAIQKLEAKNEFKAEHEIYCYIELYKRQNDPEKKERLKTKITQACTALVCDDIKQWNTYVARPLDFISDSKLPHFGISDDLINKHLDYYLEIIRQEGFIDTNWQWGGYPNAWKKAKREWQGVLTLKVLLLFKSFGRLRFSQEACHKS